MNIRKIVTYNALRKQFTPEELIFADTLYNASESERELLITALQPEKVVTKRAGKKSASRGASKSSRASGIGVAINRSLSQGRQSAIQDPACSFRYKDDTYCTLPESSPIHDPEGGYAGYHPFVSPAPRAGAKSSTNGGAGSTTVSSETEREGVGVVVGGSNE